MTTTTVPICVCAKCGYTWQARVSNPKQCPSCHQEWRKPKKEVKR